MAPTYTSAGILGRGPTRALAELRLLPTRSDATEFDLPDGARRAPSKIRASKFVCLDKKQHCAGSPPREVCRADLRREGQRPPGCIRSSQPHGALPNTDWRHGDFEIGGYPAREISALKTFSVRRRIHRRNMVAIVVQQFETTLQLQLPFLFLECVEVQR